MGGRLLAIQNGSVTDGASVGSDDPVVGGSPTALWLGRRAREVEALVAENSGKDVRMAGSTPGQKKGPAEDILGKS